jgi:hypothetical protein
MVTKSDAPPPIIDAPFDDALSQRYLVYALSTITARSLPDLRDGLKPVTGGSCGRCGCCGSIRPAATRNARAWSAT